MPATQLGVLACQSVDLYYGYGHDIMNFKLVLCTFQNNKCEAVNIIFNEQHKKRTKVYSSKRTVVVNKLEK